MTTALSGLAAILLALAVLTAAAGAWDAEAAARSETDRCLAAGGSIVECGGYR